MFVVRSTHWAKGFKPPHRKALIASTVSIVVALTGTVGWAAYKAQQREKIEDAAALLSTACNSDFTANSQVLNTAQKQTEQATQSLSQISSLPLIGDPSAQHYLTDSAKCLQDLKDTQNFFQAQSLSQSGAAATDPTPHPVAEWRSIQTSLEQSIALLQPIASDSAISPKAQEALKLNQTQLEKVRLRMQFEQEATTELGLAKAAKQEADRLLETASTPGDFAAAEAKMKEAVHFLTLIGQGHTASEEAQALLVSYRADLQNIHSRQEVIQLRLLVQQFQEFAQFADGLDNIQSEPDFRAYSKRVHDLQNQFKTFTEQTSLAGHPATKSLELALIRYHDVSQLWRQCRAGLCNDWGRAILTQRSNWWIPVTYELEGDTQSLVTKYELNPSAGQEGQTSLNVDDIVTRIWDQADQRVQRAERQI
ncbi:hypothetical protein [Leptolyngbya ohadii]|uniref:hypothetical protein n=1 Tax=Leptolyngbya ohadii TaxID=1962290 RepID=UPI000B59F456|nr:hypothetical protein [Leptolyngbya ohadii]